MISKLGEGAGSTIYAVRHPRTQKVYTLKHVIKHDDAHDKYISQAIHEYEIASELEHPGLRKSPGRLWTTGQ